MWLLLALACQPWSASDLDRDGFRAPADCDDGDPKVHPGALDVFGDDQDRDCDGRDGTDADSDGFVRGEGQDCADEDPDRHPGAVERCNGVDDDCDGDADSDAIDRPTWFLDDDGDGFGDDEVSEMACAAPDSRWVEAGGDCADEEPRAHPGAEDPCGGEDLDCDGTTPSCEPLVGELGDGLILAGPSDGSATGWSLAVVGDFDGDGWDDLVVGARDLGQAWILGGPFGAPGAVEDRAQTSLIGTGTDRAGVSVAALGRVNDDLLADVIIGAEWDDVGGIDAGAAWFLLGGASSGGTLSTLALHLVGEEAGDWAGRSVSGPGDVDGDGVRDLFVGAPRHGSGGAAYLVSGTVSQNTNLGASALKLVGPAGSDAGWSVAGGDLDGDGAGDLVIGGPAADGGRAWVVLGGAGNPSMTMALVDADGVLEGADGGLLGWRVVAGDVDGDGRSDLWLGAPGTGGERGTAWLVLGDLAPATSVLSVEDAAVASVSGLLAGERVGEELALVPDQDGDGWAELLVAGTGAGTAAASDGAIWLFSGGFSGALGTDEATAWRSGRHANDAFGAGLAGGDLNRDGSGDLVVGAPGAGADGFATGELAIFYGG